MSALGRLASVPYWILTRAVFAPCACAGCGEWGLPTPFDGGEPESGELKPILRGGAMFCQEHWSDD